MMLFSSLVQAQSATGPGHTVAGVPPEVPLSLFDYLGTMVEDTEDGWIDPLTLNDGLDDGLDDDSQRTESTGNDDREQPVTQIPFRAEEQP